MIVYIRCPSCGRVFYNLHKYLDERSIILENPNLNNKEKEEAHSELIKKYNFKLYCTSGRAQGTIEAHKLIVP